MMPEQENAPPDEWLMKKISEGDAAALACFYDRTAPVLYSMAKRILRDDALAEDLLQEVYSLIWQKAGMFDPGLGKPMNWAITLLRNRALDKLRARKRLSEAMSGFAEAQSTHRSDAKHSAEVSEFWDLTREALAEMPQAQRRAIELAFMHGLAHSEVAERMQQPLGTVKAWIRRGLLQLRERLAGCGGAGSFD